MKIDFSSVKKNWQRLRQSANFHNALVFLGFVVVATLLWFTLALNDNVQHNFDIRLKITNVPDSVTFINDPPQKIHVGVRDRGTSLLRSGVMRQPEISINFQEFADRGVLRFSKTDLYSALREVFSSSAQITTTTLDSLRLIYTTLPGKRVPIVVESDVEASLGNIISEPPRPSVSAVLLYSEALDLDTFTRVYTEPIMRRDLSETTKVKARIKQIPGVKAVPSVVEVTIPVEPLVRKQSKLQISTINVPEGLSVLLFPSMVDATYYVPMSKFNDVAPNIVVTANYAEVTGRHNGKLPLAVSSMPGWCVNVKLLSDSVEYTIVR